MVFYLYLHDFYTLMIGFPCLELEIDKWNFKLYYYYLLLSL